MCWNRAAAAIAQTRAQLAHLERDEQDARDALARLADAHVEELAAIEGLRREQRDTDGRLPLARAEATVAALGVEPERAEQANNTLRVLEQRAQALPTEIDAAEAMLAQHDEQRNVERAHHQHTLATAAEQRAQLQVTLAALERARAEHHRQAGLDRLAALQSAHEALAATHRDYLTSAADLEARLAAIQHQAQQALVEFPELRPTPEASPAARAEAAWMLPPPPAYQMMAAYLAWLRTLEQHAGSGDFLLDGSRQMLSQAMQVIGWREIQFFLTPTREDANRTAAAQIAQMVETTLNSLRYRFP